MTILLATESLASVPLSPDLWASQRKCSLCGDYVLDSHTLSAATPRPLTCWDTEGQRHSGSRPGPQQGLPHLDQCLQHSVHLSYLPSLLLRAVWHGLLESTGTEDLYFPGKWERLRRGSPEGRGLGAGS